MRNGFEDAFMNLQSEFISLCLELAPNVDEVFVYIYQSSQIRVFNAFFRKENRILSTNDLASEELVNQFLDLGTNDIQKLIDVCRQYDYEPGCPNEFKLIFNAKTKKFSAHYSYDNPSSETDKFPVLTFINWLQEVKAEYSRH